MLTNYSRTLERMIEGFNRDMSLLELAEHSGLPFTWISMRLGELSSEDPLSFPPSKVKVYIDECESILDKDGKIAYAKHVNRYNKNHSMSHCQQQE